LYFLRNPAGVLKALQKSLRLSRYEVLPAKGDNSEKHEPLDLNETCRWIRLRNDNPMSYVPASYIVRLADATLLDKSTEYGQPGQRDEDSPSVRRKRPGEAEVRLEGGEAIELFVAENVREKRLVHRRYDKDYEDSYPGIPAPSSDQQKRLFYIGAHLPRWHDGWVFDVSIQNDNAKDFSPRPAETWIEVWPVIAAGDSQTAGARAGQASPPGKPFVYVFYDTYYEPHRPVPVVTCRVPKVPEWPIDAKNAEIRVWCNLTPTKPDRDDTVSELRKTPFRLKDLPGVEFEVDSKLDSASGQWQVTVKETHPVDSDLNTVKVQMNPRPDRISHTYSLNRSSKRTVRHDFFYRQSSAAKADDYHVLLTTFESLKRDAITPGPERPLRVVIPTK